MHFDYIGARLRIVTVCLCLSVSAVCAQSVDVADEPDLIEVDGAEVFSTAVESDWTFRSVTLSWTPPLANTDGSVLTDMVGYRIYAGPTPYNLYPIYAIRHTGLARFVIPVLPQDARFVAMTSLNARGVESALSAIVSTGQN